MIVALLEEEKRTTSDETEGDASQELALYARNNRYRPRKDKEDIECHYCKKMGHTAWNCRQRANDVLKGKIKDRQHIVSAALMEEPPNADSGEEFVEEKAFFAF